MSARRFLLDFYRSAHHFPHMASPKDNQHSRRPRGVVPYNPGLHELVEAKNQWQHGPQVTYGYTQVAPMHTCCAAQLT